MSQWYFAVDGKQTGPLDTDAAVAFARQNPRAHAWRQGWTNWVLVSQVAELSGGAGGGAAPPRPPFFFLAA